MAIIFWLVSALSIAAAVALSTLRGTGYRMVLLGCAIVGLTPLGFIEGPGIPVYLAELLLAGFAVVVLIQYRQQLLSLNLPVFLFVFAGYFIGQAALGLLLNEATLIDLVRSIRPLAFVGLLLLMKAILGQVTVARRVSEQVIALVVAAWVLTDIVYYAAAHYGLVSVGGISGEYLARTGLVRYGDVITITLFGVANYLMFSSEQPRHAAFWLVICGVVAVLSLNRIYAFGFLIGFCWWLYTVVRHRVRVPAVAWTAGLSPIIVIVVAGVLYTRTQPEAGEVVSRITELFSLELLIEALEYRFVDPAIAGGFTLSPFTLFFGEGMGLRFYVPWFEYRGLNPWHFSVDSLFALAFFKYGIVGLGILVYALSSLLWMKPWHLANAWIWLYLLVHSGINVPGFLIFIVVLTIMRDATWILAAGRPYRLSTDRVNDLLH